MYRESLESLEKAGKYTGTSFELGCQPQDGLQPNSDRVSSAVKHTCVLKRVVCIQRVGTRPPYLSILKPKNLV